MGTWAIPKTDSEIDKAKAGIKMLESFKKLIYPIVGDDELFDCVDHAIKRIKHFIPKGDKIMIKKRKYNDKWVIGIKSYSSNPKDRYLNIVLAYIPTNITHRYVTWLYNHSDGGFHEGHYHERINDAIPEFLIRGSKDCCFNDNWIKQHDAIECHYVQFIQCFNYWEECKAKYAQMVSVYLHKPEGGISCITDHLNGLDAMRIVRYISNKYELPVQYQPEGIHYIKLQPII